MILSDVLTADHLRATAAVMWLCACLSLTAPAARALFWRDRAADRWKAVTFFCGFLFFAFPSRTMVRPGDGLPRIALLVLSIALATLVTAMAWRDWRTSVRRGGAR